MIAARGGDDSRLRNLLHEQIGKCAARFERACVLEQLQLQNDADRAEAKIAGRPPR